MPLPVRAIGVDPAGALVGQLDQPRGVHAPLPHPQDAAEPALLELGLRPHLAGQPLCLRHRLGLARQLRGREVSGGRVDEVTRPGHGIHDDLGGLDRLPSGFGVPLPVPDDRDLRERRVLALGLVAVESIATEAEALRSRLGHFTDVTLHDLRERRGGVAEATDRAGDAPERFPHGGDVEVTPFAHALEENGARREPIPVALGDEQRLALLAGELGIAIGLLETHLLDPWTELRPLEDRQDQNAGFHRHGCVRGERERGHSVQPPLWLLWASSGRGTGRRGSVAIRMHPETPVP